MTFLFVSLSRFLFQPRQRHFSKSRRETRVEANRSLFLPAWRQEWNSGVARSLFVDAYRRSGEEEWFNQISECGSVLDLKKNVLLNGFDSSTEKTAFFNALFQKI
jgi:hypothetical protein